MHLKAVKGQTATLALQQAKVMNTLNMEHACRLFLILKGAGADSPCAHWETAVSMTCISKLAAHLDTPAKRCPLRGGS